MGQIAVWQGDITKLEADAIVNAANELMLGGGGVDGAIHRAAGPRLVEACREVAEVRPSVRCPTGECRVTVGFDLPAKYVIHTVGPVWRGGEKGEPELLRSCYRHSLEAAVEHTCRTIAFPAISCGVFGYPLQQAAETSVDEIRRFLLDHEENELMVTLVGFDSQTIQVLEAAVRRPLA